MGAQGGTGQGGPGWWWSGPWEGGRPWASPGKTPLRLLWLLSQPLPIATGPDPRIKPLNCASWELPHKLGI